MRVIAGKYGGRRLISFDEDHIRPTTDRVKESWFNILSTRVEDAKVLDLFSGTGNLGIEALSRGAKSVEFVELNPRSITIIRENLELIKCDEPTHIHRSDAVRFAENYVGEPFDLVLIDPPFPLKICGTIIMAVNGNKKLFHSETIIAIEHQKSEELTQILDQIECYDTRKYGDKKVSFYRVKA